MIIRKQKVTLMDGKLTLEVGGKSPSTNDWAYTFLSFLWIEPTQ